MDPDLLEIANGNEQAAAFLSAFLNKCHLFDDLVDKDYTVTDEGIVLVELEFFKQTCMNPWVRDHTALIYPLIVSALVAWRDANRWEKSRNKTLVRDADVLKGIYHEVFWVTASICGGVQHMLQITEKFREYKHAKQGRN